MKRILTVATIAFALAAGTVAVMTAGPTPAVACNSNNCR
jgi:hypothetical protein